MVKAFWFRMAYRGSAGRARSATRRAGKSYADKTRSAIVLYTGESLAAVVAGIQDAERGRLARNPGAHRLLRFSAIYSPPLDPAFKLFVDETLRLANNSLAASL